jgi:site-specific DNA-methyltransferase (adenine-specific)
MHERTLGHFVSLNSPRYLNPTIEDIWHLTPNGDSPIDPRAEDVGVPYVWADQPARFGHHRERHCRGAAWHIPYRTVQSAADRDNHPATFPVALPLMCLRLAALPAEAVVLHPFMGTGAALLAARALGVAAIGIELDPAYCAAAQRRLDEAVTLL